MYCIAHDMVKLLNSPGEPMSKKLEIFVFS